MLFGREIKGRGGGGGGGADSCAWILLRFNLASRLGLFRTCSVPCVTFNFCLLQTEYILAFSHFFAGLLWR